MPRKKKSKQATGAVSDYRYDDAKRRNNPPAGLASQGRVRETPKLHYAYDFLDTDYDGRTFCITQAFFPDRSAWKKLERALRGTIDEERFDALTGTTSLPFRAGEHKRVAVKVIDPRGNEVMRVHRVSDA